MRKSYIRDRGRHGLTTPTNPQLVTWIADNKGSRYPLIRILQAEPTVFIASFPRIPVSCAHSSSIKSPAVIGADRTYKGEIRPRPVADVYTLIGGAVEYRITGDEGGRNPLVCILNAEPAIFIALFAIIPNIGTARNCVEIAAGVRSQRTNYGTVRPWAAANVKLAVYCTPEQGTPCDRILCDGILCRISSQIYKFSAIKSTGSAVNSARAERHW